MAVDCSNVIFNGIDNGIVILDQECTVLAWNRWLEVFTGKSFDEVKDTDLCELFCEIERKKLQRKIKTTLVTDSPSYYNTEKLGYLIKIPLSNITSSVYNRCNKVLR
jgi:PAS domain S-box-containing protein